ncbi:hypothetical protein THOM_1556 [Trachipleistophora hominis]|uniref:Uncharacterized protein n=1 Tax=Trachipleistophora hominis TaxID=72359 RepID=L7JVQ8_TRAHO|nr:hypothetical protein THOM_1556 [Trachipleistophora hominis]
MRSVESDMINESEMLASVKSSLNLFVTEKYSKRILSESKKCMNRLYEILGIREEVVRSLTNKGLYHFSRAVIVYI